MGTYIGTTSATDHNLYISGDLVFQANYQAGVQVLQLTGNSDLVEVANFDIYPISNEPQFNGAWTAYPFFASGSIIVSGKEQGLFVLEIDADSSISPTQSPTTSPTQSPTTSPSICASHKQLANECGTTKLRKKNVAPSCCPGYKCKGKKCVKVISSEKCAKKNKNAKQCGSKSGKSKCCKGFECSKDKKSKKKCVKCAKNKISQECNPAKKRALIQCCKGYFCKGNKCVLPKLL